MQVCRLLIRCADVFHPLRPFYLHRKWALSVANDFSNQGKLQASMGSIPDSMMSETTYVDSLGTSTIGFINSRVLPLYCRLSALFPDSVQCCNFPSHLKQTCTMWTSYDHIIQLRTPNLRPSIELDEGFISSLQDGLNSGDKGCRYQRCAKSCDARFNECR